MSPSVVIARESGFTVVGMAASPRLRGGKACATRP